MSNPKFDPGWITHRWWRDMQRDQSHENPTARSGDPGALARLRRYTKPDKAIAEAQAMSLAHRLFDKDPAMSLVRYQYLHDWQLAKLSRLGALAAVLAHVKEALEDKKPPVKKKTAQLLGPDKNGDAVMSALRFRRLIAAREPDDLMREMRNAVKLLRGTANVQDIARSMYYWDDGSIGDKIRIQWTYDYWGAGIAAPSQTQQADTATLTTPPTSAPNDQEAPS